MPPSDSARQSSARGSRLPAEPSPAGWRCEQRGSGSSDWPLQAGHAGPAGHPRPQGCEQRQKRIEPLKEYAAAGSHRDQMWAFITQMRTEQAGLGACTCKWGEESPGRAFKEVFLEEGPWAEPLHLLGLSVSETENLFQMSSNNEGMIMTSILKNPTLVKASGAVGSRGLEYHQGHCWASL